MKVFMYTDGPQDIIYIPDAKIILASCPGNGGYLYITSEPRNKEFFERADQSIQSKSPVTVEMEDSEVTALAKTLGAERKKIESGTKEHAQILNFIFLTGQKVS